MKQVTGSNPQLTANKVSIQLALGGHSFSVAELPAEALQSDAEVEIILLTEQTALVPTELLGAGADHMDVAGEVSTRGEAGCEMSDFGRKLLAANGTPLRENECAVWSAQLDGAIATIAADAKAVETIRKTLGSRVSFTTPLLSGSPTAIASVWMYRIEELLYIKVYDGKLQFAEVIPTPTEADVIYFTELLNRQFPLAKYELRIANKESKTLRKLIGGVFKRVVCE